MNHKENIVEKLTLEMRNNTFFDITKAIDSIDNLELRDRDGRTLLINAACYGYLNFVEVLLRRGADINASDGIGNTALHAAVISGNIDVIRLLLESGANINSKNLYGNTPLWVAKPTQQKEVFTTLLSFGADPNIKNNFNVSAMDCMIAYPEIIELYTSKNLN